MFSKHVSFLLLSIIKTRYYLFPSYVLVDCTHLIGSWCGWWCPSSLSSLIIWLKQGRERWEICDLAGDGTFHTTSRPNQSSRHNTEWGRGWMKRKQKHSDVRSSYGALSLGPSLLWPRELVTVVTFMNSGTQVRSTKRDRFWTSRISRNSIHTGFSLNFTKTFYKVTITF